MIDDIVSDWNPRTVLLNMFSDRQKTDFSKEFPHFSDCPICSSTNLVFWEFRYNGFRANCSDCRINWAES